MATTTISPTNTTLVPQLEFTFSVAKNMTPIITDISLANESSVSVSKNRGHLQGINTPTFYLSGIGLDSNPMLELQIGTSKCNISDYSQGLKICTISDPLLSETGHDIKVISSNGLGVIDGVNFNKYHPVSFISNITPLEGSKGGGNILTINGSGFLSEDQTAVVVFVGPYQNPQDCTIQYKTDNEIRCKVPTAFMNTFEAEVNTSIYLRIGRLQYPPAQENGEEDSFIYKFSQNLTSEVYSITNSSTILDGGQGYVEINGKGFGNDISNVIVSLIPVGETLSRKGLLRQLDIHEHYHIKKIEHKPLNPLHLSPFFSSHLERRDKIQWKVGGSGARKQPDLRNFDRMDIEKNPLHSGVGLIFEDDFEVETGLIDDIGQENYWNFVHRHKKSTLERSIERKKRSKNTHLVIRQAEMNEASIFTGNVSSVTDDTINAVFNDIPAGSYMIQVTLKITGNALNNITLNQITSVGKVDSITPSEGSVMGGQRIKIIGTGFHSMENTHVSIGSGDGD